MQNPSPEKTGDLPVDEVCAAFAAGTAGARVAAKEWLVAWAIEHMRVGASRMLRGFPRVRRWDETDDVLQEAAIRLSRALDAAPPSDGRRLLGLMALQVRRELLDLARKYGGEESFAKHHDTNVLQAAGQEFLKVDCAIDPHHGQSDDMEGWTRLHDVASRLGEEDRELFNLVWYLGLRQEDAARVLGCSVRTVARRWELTKRHLLERLAGQEPA
jgi:RNA polymerase sigma-70 factor (ECF subfamily)